MTTDATTETQAFYENIRADVTARAGTSGRFDEDSFFEIFTDELVDLGEIDTADRAFHAARSLRVDGYAGHPAEDGNLKIILCDYCKDDEPPTLTARDLERILAQGQRFIEHALDAEWRAMLNDSSAGAQLAELIAESWAAVNSVHVILISNRPLSNRVKTLKSSEVDGRPCSHLVWDLLRLKELMERGSAREPIVIDFEAEFQTTLPALKVDTHNNLYKGYLAAINGRVLAEVFQQHGARLLEQNVRVFLQARGNVNKGIRESIKNDPDRFFAYNNGITATATEVGYRQQGASGEITSLRNLQIVNGGQTTSSLHAALRTLGKEDNLDRITVQMKITVLDEADADVMVPNISKYANSQNKVSEADFHANHPFHREIQTISRRVLAPQQAGSVQQTRWFYERARGQYADQRNKLSPAKWKAFQAEHPKSQVFTKTDLAKFEMVWREQPHVVSKGAQKNFLAFMKLIAGSQGDKGEWDRNQSQFHDMYFKHVVAKMIVFRSVEQIVSNASWYDGGYRANIVAYTIARTSKWISDAGRAPDFDRIWKQQRVGEAFSGVLASIAETVNGRLLNPPANAKNISEWAKKEDCWASISTLEIPDGGLLEHVSLDMATYREQQRTANEDGAITGNVNAEIEVFNRGAEAWRDLHGWATGKTVLTPTQLNIIDLASVKGNFLSTRQADIALKAWEKSREAGWNAPATSD